MACFTTTNTEQVSGFNMLDREHRAANHAARKRRLLCSKLETLLDDAEAMLQLCSSILGQLARQENAFLEVLEKDGYTDTAMKSRQSVTTETGEALRAILNTMPLRPAR